MNIVEATASYENWLASQITIVRKDLDDKHEKMAQGGPFGFLRATYYRWLQRAPDLVTELDAPVVAAVGDLHVENFGTWQTCEGPLAWGVNDFDESECLPYTFDLARLATSASLAITAGQVPVDPASAHREVLRGYTTGLTTGGEPFVLVGQRHERLAQLVQYAAEPPGSFWKKLKTDPVDALPHTAAATVQLVTPTPGWRYRCYRRYAGLGSRGHRRYVAVGPVPGGDDPSDLACREVKEMSPPAGRWLGRARSTRALDTPLGGPPARPGLHQARPHPGCCRGSRHRTVRVDEPRDGQRAPGHPRTARRHPGEPAAAPDRLALPRRPDPHRRRHARLAALGGPPQP